MRSLYLLILISIVCIEVQAQADTVSIRNGSFEDTPRAGNYISATIKGWYDCGLVQFPRETAPDIHPINFWEVTLPASEGETYLGLVIRDNDSWESVSQRLSSPVEGGTCYNFTIDLARSSTYLSGSRSRSDDVKVQYTRPAVLRVWGSNGYCGKRELLGETVPIENFNWKTYEFKFEPKQSHLFIVIEAFYKTPVLFPYNGHILLDNASDLIVTPCNEEELLAAVDIPIEADKPKPKKESAPAKAKPKEEPEIVAADIAIAEPVQESKKQKLLNGLKKDELKKGQVLKIENLLFQADASTINNSSFGALNDIFEFLSENEKIVIEIGGHTSSVPGITNEYCDDLSERRAKAVADFLVEKGVSTSRLSYKGYGKRKPIANNSTKSGKKKNQRVEIKILSLG